MSRYTHFSSGLKAYHTVFMELGLIGSLLIFIVATNIRMEPSGEGYVPSVTPQEVVKMKDVVKTEQMERPPAPPVPQVPVEVPNNMIIEEEIPNIDAEFDLNESLEIPEPPRGIAMEKEEAEEAFFIAVEQMPELIGPYSKLKSKIRYPETALRAQIEGMVVVQFIVNKKGEVENPHVVRGIGAGCDEEAIRVIKLAKFKPGRQRGVPVRVQFSIPFRFILKQ